MRFRSSVVWGMFFFGVRKRLDGAGYVKVENSIELIRQPSHEVMTDSLRLGPVYHADGALQPFGAELARQAIIAFERCQKARNTSVMEEVFVAVR